MAECFYSDFFQIFSASILSRYARGHMQLCESISSWAKFMISKRFPGFKACFRSRQEGNTTLEIFLFNSLEICNLFFLSVRKA